MLHGRCFSRHIRSLGVLFCMHKFCFCLALIMPWEVVLVGVSCLFVRLSFGTMSLLVNMSWLSIILSTLGHCFEKGEGLPLCHFKPSCMLAPCLLHGCSIKPCSTAIPWSIWSMFASCLYLVCLVLYICHVGCIMLVLLYILVAWYIWGLWALHALHLLGLGCQTKCRNQGPFILQVM